MKYYRLLTFCSTFAIFAILPLTSIAKQEKKDLGDGWEELTNCKLIKTEGNDGDSFHVEHGGKEYVFRLYLADCPETDIQKLGRNMEQMVDFGAPLEKIIIAGKLASILSDEILSKPFKILTKWEDAMGQSKLGRSYAFVETSKGEDFGEILVTHGLARSHGRNTSAPQISQNLQEKYDRIAERAQRQGLGAWGKGEVKLPTGSLLSSADLSKAKREAKYLEREKREEFRNLSKSLGKENISISKVKVSEVSESEISSSSEGNAMDKPRNTGTYNENHKSKGDVIPSVEMNLELFEAEPTYN